MSALLAVFAVVFLGAAVEWIGYSGIASKIYDLIGGLVGINLSKQLNTSRDELLLLRQQLKATSAMDEFAKWARLRRQLDQKTAEFQQLQSQHSNDRMAFQLKVNVALRIMNGLAFMLVLYFFRWSPVIRLSEHWTGPLYPLLSLPFSPAGTISTSVWLAMCRQAAKAVFS